MTEDGAPPHMRPFRGTRPSRCPSAGRPGPPRTQLSPLHAYGSNVSVRNVAALRMPAAAVVVTVTQRYTFEKDDYSGMIELSGVNNTGMWVAQSAGFEFWPTQCLRLLRERWLRWH